MKIIAEHPPAEMYATGQEIDCQCARCGGSCVWVDCWNGCDDGYHDRYEKRSGAWGFVERSIVTDWARVTDPSTMDHGHPITRDTARGTPDDDDPAHRFFTLFA